MEYGINIKVCILLLNKTVAIDNCIVSTQLVSMRACQDVGVPTIASSAEPIPYTNSSRNRLDLSDSKIARGDGPRLLPIYLQIKYLFNTCLIFLNLYAQVSEKKWPCCSSYNIDVFTVYVTLGARLYYAS